MNENTPGTITDFFKGITDYFINNGSLIISAIVIFIVGYFSIKLILRMFKRIFKRSKLDVTFHRFLLSLIKIILYILLLIISLSTLGVNMTSLVAMLSVVSLAIGLAVQNSLSNVAGGFIILFSHPFQVGDFVEINSVKGTVKQINILNTKLLTIDNKTIYIPNSETSSSKIINFTCEKFRKLELIFSISYNEDIQKVKNLLSEIINNNEFAIKDPQPLIEVNEYASNSINILTRTLVTPDQYFDLKFSLLEEVKIVFDKNNVIIPYSQLDVHLS